MGDYRDAPTVEVLWDRAHTARKERTCSICGDPIRPGHRYSSTGQLIDGKFEHWVRHEFGERYPSGCPRLRAADAAEEASQFVRDAAIWNAEPVR